MKQFKKGIIFVLFALFSLFSLVAASSSKSDGTYKKPHFAITAYYEFTNKLWSRGSIYGLFEHVGVYASYASFYFDYVSSKTYYGTVSSTGKVDLDISHRPTDAKNHNSYYLSSAGIDYYSQFGYAFGGVLRLGDHFNISVGFGRNKLTGYKWGTIEYPSTNILGKNWLYMPMNSYLVKKDLQNVWTTWWEFGCLITFKNYAADFFITYTPLISKSYFSAGIGVAF